MARPRRWSPATALLLLAVGILVATPADARVEEKKVKMSMRFADEEESRWLDRYAETHEPLNVGKGPLLMRRATEEEAHWFNRISGPKDGGSSGSGAGDRGDVLQFDQDNPYYRALQVYAQRLIKERGGIKFVDEPEAEKEF